MLSELAGPQVVAAVGGLRHAARHVEDRAPDVVVTDIRMPPTGTDEGIRVAAELRQTHPEIGVVVLSQYAEPEYVLDAARGRLGSAARTCSRSASTTAASSSTRSAPSHAGGSYIDPKIVEVLVEGRAARPRSPLAELTPRERETLAEIAQGKSNAAIAESLVLTKRAVEKHINAIFMKLNLARRPTSAAASRPRCCSSPRRTALGRAGSADGAGPAAVPPQRSRRRLSRRPVRRQEDQRGLHPPADVLGFGERSF